jgi:non-canonical purine NTP pyrophosphatase (RdgB/HAM1 family)
VKGRAASGPAGARPRFAFVTGNPAKLEEARRIVGSGLEGAELDLPEMQSLDLMAVLRAKGEEAWRRLARPLVVEETGLELAALGGFPGPLVRWMLEAVGPRGIARTALALGEARATARCGLLYRDGQRQVEAAGEARGRLVLPPRGAGGFGWDPVFVPEGEERTYAELPPEVKDAIGHRGQAWRALLAAL